MDAIFNFSKEDKIELIAVISDSMVTKVSQATADAPSRQPWDAGARKVSDLTHKEWLAHLDKLSGAWSDMPEDIAEQLMSARSVPDRQINLDD